MWGAAGTAAGLAGSAEEAGLVELDAWQEADCTDWRMKKNALSCAGTQSGGSQGALDQSC